MTVSNNKPVGFNPFISLPPILRKLVIFFCAIYALVCSCLGFANVGAAGPSLAIGILTSVLLLYVILIPFVHYRREYGLMHPLIIGSLLALLNYFLRRTGLFIAGMPPGPMTDELDTFGLNMLFSYGNIVIALSFLAIYSGFSFGPKFRVPQLGFRTGKDSTPMFYVGSVFFLLVGLAGFYFYASVSGGILGVINNLAKGASFRVIDADVAGIGQYVWPMKALAALALIWVAYISKPQWNPIVYVLVALSLVVGYAIGGKRSEVIYPLIAIILTYTASQRRIPYFQAGAIALFSLIFFGVAGAFREHNTTKDQADMSVLQDVDAGASILKSFDEIAQRSSSMNTFYPILLKVPSEVDMLYGKSYLENVYRFIPRQLWPAKPRGIDVQACVVFYGGNWGMPPGAVGEAYWNFHLPGVIIVFFIFGVFLRFLAGLYATYSWSPGAIVLYVITLFYFSPAQNSIRVWMEYFVPALLMMIVMGFLSPGIFGRPQLQTQRPN